MAPAPPARRVPAASVAALVFLTAATGFVLLVFAGRIPLVSEEASPDGPVFYLVPYHYGFAIYDRQFREIERIEVEEGTAVTLHIVPALALAKETFLAYADRTIRAGIGGRPPGDPHIRHRIEEDLKLGDVEHIIGITAHPVHVTTNVAEVLGGRFFREGAPRTVREAVERKDPTIKTFTFTAKRVGEFDVLCVDSGIGGEGTCGWGHQWMVAKKALAVR